VAQEGNSKLHIRSSWPAAEVTAGETVDLDGLSAAGAAASPGAAMYGQPTEVLLEGAEYGAETEDVAGSSDAAAAAGVRPQRLVDWGAEGGGGVLCRSGGCGHGERDGGFGGDEAAATAAGGAVEDGSGAPAMAEACGAGPPVKPFDWPTMTKRQQKNWYERGDGQMGNASEEAARTATGGVAGDRPGASLATTHGPSAEVLCEGGGFDVDMGNAVEASAATAAAGAVVRPLKPGLGGCAVLASARRESRFRR